MQLAQDSPFALVAAGLLAIVAVVGSLGCPAKAVIDPPLLLPAGDGGGGEAGSGGSLSGGGGTGGTAGSGGVGGAGGTGGIGGWGTAGAGGNCLANSGDCDTDEDCPQGDCVPLTTCGFQVCEAPFAQTTSCSSGMDECCTSADCPNGEQCFQQPLAPYCGLIPQPELQVCTADECSLDSDCTGTSDYPLICVPASTMGRAVAGCVPASCKVDQDCQAEPAGSCAPVVPHCCSGPIGLFCVYPSDGCRSDDDCTDGYCDVVGGRASCFAGLSPCPA